VTMLIGEMDFVVHYVSTDIPHPEAHFSQLILWAKIKQNLPLIFCLKLYSLTKFYRAAT
jgi:hypothetical protein